MAKNQLEKPANIQRNPFFAGIDPDIPKDGYSIADSEVFGDFGDVEPNGLNDDEDLLGAIEKISQNTLATLKQSSLPCLPSSYQIYFEKLLDREPPAIKNKIRSIMDMQSDIHNRTLIFEKSISENVKIIKWVLNCISMIYQNLAISQNIVKLYAKDMEQADNKLVFKNIKDLFVRDTGKIIDITSTQLEQIQSLYDKISTNLKNIGQNSVYDLNFDVYSKKYFISILQKEQKLCNQFNHSSVLICISLSNQITSSIGKETSTFDLLLKTMVKFLRKNINFSDALAHVGDGVFGILFKYADVEQAQKLCDKLHNIAQSTDVFVSDTSIQLDITTNIVGINDNKPVEDILRSCLSSLRSSFKEKQSLKPFSQDLF